MHTYAFLQDLIITRTSASPQLHQNLPRVLGTLTLLLGNDLEAPRHPTSLCTPERARHSSRPDPQHTAE